ncbi:MAG: hypothetical protein Q8Q97_02965, partial [bacterium]|nr:hypothetical protein [bacterium]
LERFRRNRDTDKLEITLSQFYALLAPTRTYGQPGKLFTNGTSNYFHIRDAEGKLRAVVAGWPHVDQGWFIGIVDETKPVLHAGVVTLD